MDGLYIVEKMYKIVRERRSTVVEAITEGNVHDYDILPQMPIILGAGGVVTDWDGRPLADAARFDTVLMAANAQLHAAALETLHAG